MNITATIAINFSKLVETGKFISKCCIFQIFGLISLFHLLHCWFLVMYSSFELMYSSFLTGSFYVFFNLHFYVSNLFGEVLTKFMYSSLKFTEYPFFIVVQLSPFPPLLSPALSASHLPHSILPPHCLCPWTLYTRSFTWPLKPVSWILLLTDYLSSLHLVLFLKFFFFLFETCFFVSTVCLHLSVSMY